jgi:5-methylcytosine-specific restriction endonuclease McrA
MAADIRNNIAYFSEECAHIKENRELYREYMNRVNTIVSEITEKECEQLKISISRFRKREAVLFRKSILKPVLDCTYTVMITYASPKGQVTLKKEETFYADNISRCLESVSRTKLDRYTYEQLAKVERFDVSDSLRYNIMARDKFRCVICGASSVDGVQLHIDHIIPISKGGKSVPDNLRTLCERCNIGKSDKIENINDNPFAEDKDELCPLCAGRLVLRKGKFGQFYGCSGYPKCKYTKQI